MYVQKVHFVETLYVEHIDAKSDKGCRSEEGEYKLAKKQSKVRFCHKDSIAYYEKDHLDDSEEEKALGVSNSFDFESMERNCITIFEVMNLIEGSWIRTKSLLIID